MTAVIRLVSEEVMERVSDAIDAVRRDESLPRTKRAIEGLSALSHATVARAFAQDARAAADSTSSKWRLSERFALMSTATGRRNVHGAKTLELKLQLAQKNTEIAMLKTLLEQYAQALYILQLAREEKHAGITEIGVNKSRRRRNAN